MLFSFSSAGITRIRFLGIFSAQKGHLPFWHPNGADYTISTRVNANAFGLSRGFRLQSVLTVGWRPRFIRFNPPTVGELKRSMPKNASAMQARHLALISGGYLLTRIV